MDADFLVELNRAMPFVPMKEVQRLSRLVFLAHSLWNGSTPCDTVNRTNLVFRILVFIDWKIARFWANHLGIRAPIPPPVQASITTHCVNDTTLGDMAASLLRRSPSSIKISCPQAEEKARDLIRLALSSTTRLSNCVINLFVGREQNKPTVTDAAVESVREEHFSEVQRAHVVDSTESGSSDVMSEITRLLYGFVPGKEPKMAWSGQEALEDEKPLEEEEEVVIGTEEGKSKVRYRAEKGSSLDLLYKDSHFRPCSDRVTSGPVSYATCPSFSMKCLAIALLGNMTSVRASQHEALDGLFDPAWSVRVYACRIWAVVHGYTNAELAETLPKVPASERGGTTLVFVPELGFSKLARPPVTPLMKELDTLSATPYWLNAMSGLTAVRCFTLDRLYAKCPVVYDLMLMQTAGRYREVFDVVAADCRCLRSLTVEYPHYIQAEKTMQKRSRKFAEVCSRILKPGSFWTTIANRHKWDADREPRILKWQACTPPALLSMLHNRVLAQIVVQAADDPGSTSLKSALDLVSIFSGSKPFVVTEAEDRALKMIPPSFGVHFLVTSRLGHAAVDSLGAAPGMDAINETTIGQHAQLEKLLLSFYRDTELDTTFSDALDATRTRFPRLYAVLAGMSRSAAKASQIYLMPILPFEWTAAKAAALIYQTGDVKVLENPVVTSVPLCPNCNSLCCERAKAPDANAQVAPIPNVWASGQNPGELRRLGHNEFSSQGSQGSKDLAIDIFGKIVDGNLAEVMCGRRRGACAAVCHRTQLWRAPIVGSILYFMNKAYVCCADPMCGYLFEISDGKGACNQYGLICPRHKVNVEIKRVDGENIVHCVQPRCEQVFAMGPFPESLTYERLLCPRHAYKGHVFHIDGRDYVRCHDRTCGKMMLCPSGVYAWADPLCPEHYAARSKKQAAALAPPPPPKTEAAEEEDVPPAKKRRPNPETRTLKKKSHAKLRKMLMSRSK